MKLTINWIICKWRDFIVGDFWEFLVTSGIATLVIGGVSGWIGGILKERSLENKLQKNREDLEKIKQENKVELEKLKQKFMSEIEESNNHFQIELSKVDKRNETAVYISKSQYDREINVFREIWVYINKCNKYIEKVIDKDIWFLEDENKKHEKHSNGLVLTDFKKNINHIDKIILEDSPFYKKEFYDKFIEVTDLIREINNSFEKEITNYRKDRDNVMWSEALFKMECDKLKEEAIANSNKIKDLQIEIREEIREYLLRLQII